MAKKSKEQKLQAQVKKLAHELKVVNYTNKTLTEQVNRSEIRANDHRTAMQQKEDYQRVLNDKLLTVTAERDRMIRMVDQFTSIQIFSPTSETRALRHTKIGL